MVDVRHQSTRVERLEFHLLVRALQRRLGDLEQFHWEGRTTGADYSAAVRLAEGVRLSDDRAYIAGQRRRATGGKRSWMDMEGLVGELVYEGDLAPFARLIRYGEIVNVGKMAAFGMGTYEVTE